MLRRSRTTCVTCTFAVVTAKRRECDVYVACTWHRRADIAEDPRVRKLLTVKRPESRAPAQVRKPSRNTVLESTVNSQTGMSALPQ